MSESTCVSRRDQLARRQGVFQQDLAVFLKNSGEIECLMHFLYGLMVAGLQLCGSPKTMNAAERFCPVTKRFKTVVTLNQPDKAQFREADLYKGWARLFFTLYQSGVTALNPAE